jgi:large subunit ribosomal protein L13
MTEETKTHTIDAKGKVLGRLSTEIANLLRGKGKVCFVFNKNVGDKVVVINAKDIVLTGRKVEQKQYARHSGYLGNLRYESVKDLIKNKPEEIIKKSVLRMLPKNRLQKDWMKNLTIHRAETN